MEPKDHSEATETVEKPKASKAAGRKPAEATAEPETEEQTADDAPTKTETEGKSQNQKKADTTTAEFTPTEPAEQEAAPRARSNATLNKDALTKKEKEAPAPVEAKSATGAPKPADAARKAPAAVDASDPAAVEKRLAEIQNQIKLLEAETKLATIQAAKAKAEQATTAEEDKRVQEDRKAVRELLDAHKGNIPAIILEVNKELQSQMRADKGLVLDKRLEFSTANSLRVPLPTEQLSLTGSSDFFALPPADQQNLYDRIGLFRGIVVDHRHELPVEQGYRNVCHFGPGPADASPADAATTPVQVFYRKPRLSGYAESTYAFDEEQLKTQKSGIFSFAFGLSASFRGFGKTAAVKAGYGYANERNDETSFHEQKVSVTSNFFLPKIELSLDTLRPAAHPDFVDAVRQALAGTRASSSKFEQLNRVLRQFGHFVATSLTIGGRLYSTETKTISSGSQLHSFLEKKALDIQVAARGWGAEVGGEVKRTEEVSDKSHTQKASENQASQLHAVGGEGVFVNNPARWVESLVNYTAWSLVKYDDLVPSLTLLPPDLQQQCHALLSEVVADPATTIEGLLEQQAHYLFYDGYLEPYGRLVEPRYFVLKGIDSDNRVLSVTNGRRTNDADAQLGAYEDEPHQQWWLTPAGTLRCRRTPDEPGDYVLALNGDRLVVNQEGYFPNQRWELAGGLLKNVEAKRYVVIRDKSTLALGNEDEARSSRNVWQLSTEEQLRRLRQSKPRKTLLEVKDTRPTRLPNGSYLTPAHTLVSAAGTAQLRLDGPTLRVEVLEVGKMKEVWKKTFEQPIEQLVLENGVLDVVLTTKERVAVSASVVASGFALELLDCGNLELFDRAGDTIWESNSVVYATLKRAGSAAVLSFHHTDFEPQPDAANINLTAQPFVQADHQLWYLNRHQQLVSKLRRSDGVRLALTCPDDGPVVLQALNVRDKAQQWSVAEKGYGPVGNLKTNRYLQHSDVGCKVGTTAATTDTWELKPQSVALSQRANGQVQLVKSPVEHQENADKGYMHFKNGFEGYIHLEQVDLQGGMLRGLKLIKYGNRLAVRARVRKADNTQVLIEPKKWDDTQFASYKKDEFRLDRAPVYLGEDAKRLGLRAKDNAYALAAGLASGTAENRETGHTVHLAHHTIDFVDTTEVLAPDGADVVGFGFTTHAGNRVAPYLLVVNKIPQPAAG